MVTKVLTSIKFNAFLNPERTCKYSSEELKEKPLFKDIVNNFLTFIDGSKLIFYNAPFDIKFLNYELSLVDKPPLKVSNCVDV